MAFLAPAAAAGGAGAVGAGGLAGLGTAAGTAAAGTTALGTSLAAGGAGLGALGTGLATGAATTAGIFGGGLTSLGGLANTAGAAGAGLSGFGGLGAAKTLGTTAALEGAKKAVISNAMQQQAMQNAIMQNMAGGIASPTTPMSQLGAQYLAKSQAAGMPIASPNNPLLRASVANVNLPASAQGVMPESLLPAPNVTPTVTPQVAPTATDVTGGFRGIDPTRISSQGLKLDPTATVDPTTVMGRGIRPEQNFLQNLGNIGSFQDVKDYAQQHPYATSAMAGLGLQQLMKQKPSGAPEQSKGMIRPYTFDYNAQPGAYDVSPTADSSERLYFNPVFTAQEPYEAPGPEYKASGGITAAYAVGGPVEQMAAMNSVGMNTGYPMANINTPMYSNPMMQRPEAVNVIAPSAGAGVGAFSGEPRFASGGISDLGGYSDGGRLLKGPGDGVSDSIPAVIGQRQPARLADGEFVVPARIVSEIGNGSTEAGARKLYSMMDRVQNARRKTIGKNKVAKDTKADKYLPA